MSLIFESLILEKMIKVEPGYSDENKENELQQVKISLEQALKELDTKKKEIAVFVKKHVKVERIEKENVQLAAKNKALEVEIDLLRKQVKELEADRIEFKKVLEEGKTFKKSNHDRINKNAVFYR